MRRLRSGSIPDVFAFELALAAAFMLLAASSISEDVPPAIVARMQRAEELLRELRTALMIDQPVQIAAVAVHPLIFAVSPADMQKSRFILSMELGFLLSIDDEELRAALAHELGHVWIFTHHPFLHTERLANSIAQQAVPRDRFERLYSKLWAYEGKSGVDLDQLLGPRPPAEPEVNLASTTVPVEAARQAATERAPEIPEGSGEVVWARGFEGQLIAGLDGDTYEPIRTEIIERVQETLKTRGLYSGPINGVLDLPTMKAVYAFQRERRITPLSGVPTPQTRRMIEQGSHTDPPPRTGG
jgi:hypothetical protein